MRRIDKIIIHCTGTKASHDVTIQDVKQWHVNGRKFSDIGYHYFIRLDGAVEMGRDIKKVGAHCFGHNKRSIGICYAGGVADDFTPKDTRTDRQKRSLRALIKTLQMFYPNATIHGHNEFSNKACPSFNVQTEL